MLKMCSKDDFLDWNDIDLDIVLGEYTDDDFYSADNTSSSDSEYDAKFEAGETHQSVY
jgi:hypothetical protein